MDVCLNEAAGGSEAVLWGFNPWQGLRATPCRPPHNPRQPPFGFPRTLQRRDLPQAQAPQPRFPLSPIPQHTPDEVHSTRPPRLSRQILVLIYER